MAKRHFFFIAATLFGLSLHGQEMEYAFVKYEDKDGIPTSEVYSVMEDSQGYLWFTTEIGVSRFDGYTFDHFSLADGLTGYTVFRSYEDDFGRIWFTMFNGGLCYYENDSICEYPHNAILSKVIPPKRWVTYLEVDSDQNLHFFSFDHVFGTITKEGHLLNDKEDLEVRLEITFPIDSSKFPWIKFYAGQGKGTSTDLKVVVDDTTNYWLSNNENGQIKFMDADKGGYHIIHGEQLIYITRKEIIKIPFERNLIGISMDQRENVWVRTYGQGVAIYDEIQKLKAEDEPRHQILGGLNVSQILFNENGESWLAIQNQGIHHILNRDVENYIINGTYRKQKIVSVFRDAKNDIYYTSENGKIIRVDQNEEHHETRNINLPINRLYQDSSGHLYVSTFYNKDDLNDEDITLLNGRTFEIVDGDMNWNAHGTQITLKRGDEFIYRSSSDSIRDHFYCIFNDRLGRTFVGGQAGLYQYKNGHLSLLKLNSPAPEISIADIDQLSDGTLVLGGLDEEIIFLTEKEEDFIPYHVPLPGYMIEIVHVDQNDMVWMSTNKGLLKFEFDSNYNYCTFNITTEHGLASNEINDISSRGDVIYVATDKGLSVFSSAELVSNTKPPKIHIKQVAVNGKNVPLDKELVLAYSENYLEFSFLGICYRKQGNVEYKYRLKGVDSGWQRTTARDARYPSLLPGHYIFEVKACNEDDFWSAPQQFSFYIDRPFWKKWWFIILMALLGFVALSISYRVVRKNARARQEKNEQIERQKRKIIETELKALRAQMNPHFTFNTLNSLQNSIKKFDQKKALKYTNDFSLLMRKVLENSQSIFISIEEEIKMLTLYIELENMRINNEMVYEFKIDPNIDIEFQEIPSMIIQPIVENAITHGLNPKTEGTKELLIQMVEKPNGIMCIVEDNGIGREQSEILNRQKKMNKSSMGTAITKERLELFYAEVGKEISFNIIDLFAENGEALGTRVEFFFKNE